MATIPHRLSKTCEHRLPSRIVAFDAESWVRIVGDPVAHEEHTLRLGCAIQCDLRKGDCYYRDVFHFRTASQFWGWLYPLVSRKQTLWVFAHNLAFDLTLVDFWRMLLKSDWKLRSFALDDPPTSILLTTPRGSVRFTDSLNYWRVALSDLGETVGVPKYIYPGQWVTNDLLTTYCERDTEIVEFAVRNLIQMCVNMGSWGPTAPSLALSIFRHSFMDSATAIHIHGDEEIDRRERAAYFGGRCEVLRHGIVDEPVFHLDVNSLYPSVMRNRNYPVRHHKFYDSVTMSDLAKMVRDWEVIASVEILSSHRNYPVRRERRTTFERSVEHTSLAGDELRSAMYRGDCFTVYHCDCYDGADIFSGYIAHFAKLKERARQEGDKGASEIAKMLMNSLVGKLGQRGKVWKNRPDIAPPSAYGQFWHFNSPSPIPFSCRSVAWQVQSEQETGPTPWTLAAIPASVCAAGRVEVDAIVDLVGDDHILYRDCDALHVDDVGFYALKQRNLIDPHQTGNLKVTDSALNAEYRGARDYTIGSRRVVCGVSPKAVQIADGVYLQDWFEGLHSILAREPDGAIRVRTRETTRRYPRAGLAAPESRWVGESEPLPGTK